MLIKKQVQEALGRIDQVLAQVNSSRQGHAQLANDMHLVQVVCMEHFANMESTKEAKIIPIRPEVVEDGRTDEPVVDAPACDKDS